MPIHEYRCNRCRKRVSVFFRSFSVVGDAVCPECGGADMKRIITPPTVLRSSDYKMDRTDDILRQGEFDRWDKRKLAAWSKRVSEELGGEAGERIREKVERMESGEFVSEMADPEYFTQYVAEEHKKQMIDAPNDLDPGSKPPADSSDEF